MGRRSRQRTSAPQRERAGAPAPPAVTTAARRSRRDSAPQPPWGSFPLVELCALIAIVFGIWGIATGNGVLLTAAALLGSIAGLEVALREHLGGYRSHTTLLAAFCAIATLTAFAFAGVGGPILFAVPAAVLGTTFVAFRQLFVHRSGGVGVKVR
jgi:hypothetical protein